MSPATQSVGQMVKASDNSPYSSDPQTRNLEERILALAPQPVVNPSRTGFADEHMIFHIRRLYCDIRTLKLSWHLVCLLAHSLPPSLAHSLPPSVSDSEWGGFWDSLSPWKLSWHFHNVMGKTLFQSLWQTASERFWPGRKFNNGSRSVYPLNLHILQTGFRGSYTMELPSFPTASDSFEQPSSGSLKWISRKVSRIELVAISTWHDVRNMHEGPSDGAVRLLSRKVHVAFSTRQNWRNIFEGRYGRQVRRFPVLFCRDCPWEYD